MIKILQNGKKGFYNFYGIQSTVKIENGKHIFVKANMADGTDIVPDKDYIGVSSDFLLGGGDDFSDIINIIYKPRDVKDLGEFRDSIREVLKNKKVIKEGSLIDPEHPRLIVI